VLAVLSVPHLALTRAAAIRAGSLLRSLRTEGRSIDVRDAMQAGICLDAGVSLVTRNVGHFERVPGLRVLDPGALGSL
jgi:predicted nucleic acid-binding protein